MEKELSESEEEYLEALYKLSRNNDEIKVGKLAEELEIRKSSAVEMLKKLENKELVNYKKYSGVKLTEIGEKEGLRVTRRHRLAERLLSDVLNRDLSEVHEEACRLEHSIADETADEIARFLENPDTCPHGYPIPKEEMEDLENEDNILKLTKGEEGEDYEVVSIPEDEDDVQRLLPLGVLPGSKIILEDKSSVGAIMVRKGSDKLALSRKIGSKIRVRPYERKRRTRKRHGRSSGKS